MVLVVEEALAVVEAIAVEAALAAEERLVVASAAEVLQARQQCSDLPEDYVLQTRQ